MTCNFPQGRFDNRFQRPQVNFLFNPRNTFHDNTIIISISWKKTLRKNKEIVISFPQWKKKHLYF